MVYNLGHHPKPRKDENVDFWVPKKSKEVLVENGVTSTRGIKKRGVEVTVREKHRDRPGQDRKGQEEQYGG